MSSKPQPPLMKKHSQTDLVSRLKTRKILGVGGEDDDGEIHRSKISQMLGNQMRFGVREPIGLRIWILMSAVLFTTIALIALVFPSQLYEFVFELRTTRISIRLYGGALLSVSLIMWNGLYTAEKAIIQWTLLTEACLLSVQFLVYLGPRWICHHERHQCFRKCDYLLFCVYFKCTLCINVYTCCIRFVIV
ncbi:tumor protein p53-inducible protein 11-like isoform 2-T2 [Salvelinus alpinus]